MNVPNGRLRATAYHEAGHAVAAYALNLPLGQVSIAPKDDYAGACVINLPRWLRPDDLTHDLNPRGQDWIERCVQVALAGHVAEKSWTGRNNHAGARADREHAADLARIVCGTEAESIAFLRWLEVRTQSLIGSRRCQSGIDALAAELLHRRRLTPTEAKSIIRAGIQAARRRPKSYGGPHNEHSEDQDARGGDRHPRLDG